MRKIFKNKIRYAVDNLHPWLKQKIGEPKTDNAFELKFKNGSSISVSMSTRSGTVQFLHISEFGKICAKYPEKAQEIVTGAINSVHAGQFVSIESTAEGQEGYFYTFCMDAERARKEGRTLTALDFKIFFFPWNVDPRYTLEGDVMISEQDAAYFKSLKDLHGISLTPGQQRWYVKKKQLNQGEMFREYPSLLAECFSASIEGTFYASEMQRVYAERRIMPVPYDPLLGVETAWDIGLNDSTAIVCFQTFHSQIRIINYYENSGEGLPHYLAWLQEQTRLYGYRYDRHILPHDIEVKELTTGISRYETLLKLGLRNLLVAPKAPIQDGIERVRAIFPRFVFDEVKTKKLTEHLFNYKKEWDTKRAVWKNNPRHDGASHGADAVRYLATMWRDYSAIPYEQDVSTAQSFF